MPAPPSILFADQRLVVLDKPAGLPCHRGPRGGASVEDWFPLLSRRRDGPWLAHRLDADTSGCLVVALRKATLLALQAGFAAGSVEKTYWALTHAPPEQQEGLIDLPLAKRTGPAGWRMLPDPAGKPAVTAWRVLRRRGGTALLELRPRTGRTHQLRVHCAAIGSPIAGDPLYGSSVGDEGERGSLQLLARAIRLPLDPPVSAEAPPLPAMRAFT